MSGLGGSAGGRQAASRDAAGGAAGGRSAGGQAAGNRPPSSKPSGSQPQGGRAAGADSAAGAAAGPSRTPTGAAASRRPGRFARAQGFPAIGRTIPAGALTAVTVVAGAAASWFVVGLSGWLVVALLLLLAAAAVPRGPFAAILSVVLSISLVLNGLDGYTGRFVLLLAAVHLLLVVGSLAAWLPRRAHVQLAVLRPSLLRYVVVQVIAQVLAFVILTFVVPRTGPGTASGFAWLGIVGAVAALALALVVLIPALLRPSR